LARRAMRWTPLEPASMCHKVAVDDFATNEGAPAMKITTIGLDIAKSVFQVHGVDEEGVSVVMKRLHRKQVLPFFSKLPSCLIGIPLRANRSETYWLLKFTLEGAGERTHGYALTEPACSGCCV
jgi:hypothetical protein